MEKNKARQMIVTGVTGFSAALGFINGYLLMIMYTFHDNYRFYHFIRGGGYVSLVVFIISVGYGVKLVKGNRKNKKAGLVRFFLPVVITFVFSFMIIALLYRHMGIL